MAVRSGRQEPARAAGEAEAVGGVAGNVAGRTGTPVLVGRDRELAAVSEALARPAAVVLVEGEAGIGKTRLVQEFLASPAAEQYRVLVAVCPPFREALTLGPVVDAIRQTRGSVAGLRLSALAGALRPVFPEWAAELPPVPEPLDDAKASRHRLLSALADLIERLGVGVLVVEDAHWADEATLELLLLLTSRQRPPSLVVSYRPEDMANRSLLRRLSARVPAGVTHLRLTLEPLDLPTTACLVSSMLDGGPVSDEFTTFLHEHTDGLPLLVEESVRLLHDRADLIRRDGQWVRRSLDELHVPPTVRDAVLARLDRLRGDARRVLDAVAVFSEPVDQTTLGTVAGLTAARARAGLTEGLASGLLGEDDRHWVAFHHDLLGRAVYEAIPGPHRQQLHLAAGYALETSVPLSVVQLTRHFREAGEMARWAEYAEQAADMAVASNDHTTAAKLINDVLSTVVLSADTGVRLAIKLAHATLFRAEDVDDLNRAVVSTLRNMLDSQELKSSKQADIRNPLGRLLMQLGDWEAGYRELELAATNLNDPVEAARVMTYLAFPFVGLWPASVYRGWLRRAAELHPSVESPVDGIMLAADRATALLLLGDEEGWEFAAGLPTTASSREERRELSRAYSNLASGAMVWGRYADAGRCLATARDLAEADGYLALRFGMQLTQANLDWLSGRWAGLADRLTALLDVRDSRLSLGGVACAMGRLRSAQGVQDQAQKHFQLALERALLQGLVDDVLEPAAGIGRLRLGEGRVDDALQVTNDAMQIVVGKGVWVWATEIAPVRVEALVAAQRADEAGSLVAMFARGLHGRNAPAPRAALALCRALLLEGKDQPDRAVAAFGRAARAWERLPRPYDALLARERQALRLLAADRTEAGLALLSEVYERLFDLGARGDADRVAGELRELGADVPRLWRGGRKGYGDQLSPRELDVVRLVVAGKTNREIAVALSKSPRTVGMQVRSAMRKLGASSRTALAVSAIQAGADVDEPHPAPPKSESA